MSPTFDAVVRSWPLAPWLLAGLVASAVVYLRGWSSLRRRGPGRWHAARLVAFLASLGTLYLAIASPIEVFASLLLQVHMLQHLLLVMVAPPLMWLAAPLLPLVRGLPTDVRRYWVAPLLRNRKLRGLFTWLTQPVVAWTLFVSMTWLWHLPRAYELALNKESWHIAEHVCFLASALLFWYPVVRPYPARARFSAWVLAPYLLLADVQNTLLAAWLTFSPQVIYPHYSEMPRLAGTTALADQAAAGVLMWVPGSIAFLLPLFLIGVGQLFPHKARRVSLTTTDRGLTSLFEPALVPSSGRGEPQSRRPARPGHWDLLRVPLLGRFLRWRVGGLLLQATAALVALAILVDGFTGPQAAPRNLAGVVPWIHWRGLLMLSLLVLGNVFCMACPFTLPRRLAGRLLPRGRTWPRVLRSKWLAVSLLVLFLWSYEAFSLWESPWITAWIVAAYFVAAFVVDGFFQDAAFCKYVCPIGQFNFVQSLVSPWEVSVREPAVCATCTTHECLHGTPTQAGCQLQLFQPRKRGNFDCTFCLDCVRACPHENVGVLAVIPGQSLLGDPARSGIGRFSRRLDLAALVLVVVFGAFANAGGMIGPVVAWQDSLGELIAVPRIVVIALFYSFALVVLPLLLVGVAALLSRACFQRSERTSTVAARFVVALIPLGVAMWTVHYGFHLATSCDAIWPVSQRFAADHGLAALGPPQWQWACCRPVGDWLLHLEFVILGIGLLGSLYLGYRIAESQATGRRALTAFAPWGVLMLVLYAVGVWIMTQPMEMRGTLPGSNAAVAQSEK